MPSPRGRRRVPAPSAPRRHVPRAGRAKKATVSLHSRVVETHRDYYAASNVTIKRRLRRSSPQRSSSAARKETEREREGRERERENRGKSAQTRARHCPTRGQAQGVARLVPFFLLLSFSSFRACRVLAGYVLGETAHATLRAPVDPTNQRLGE
jgi:hypothetical protein